MNVGWNRPFGFGEDQYTVVFKTMIDFKTVHPHEKTLFISKKNITTNFYKEWVGQALRIKYILTNLRCNCFSKKSIKIEV